MSEKRFCLQCDDGTLLVHTKKDLTETVEGLSMSVSAVAGWHCPVCGDCEFDTGEGKRYSAALAELRRSANEKRAHELRAMRKKLGLKQAEAGRLFGGGVNAFSEYERGKTRPPRATVVLLRLLDRHPELLAEIR